MSYVERAWPTSGRSRFVGVAVLVVGVALGAFLVKETSATPYGDLGAAPGVAVDAPPLRSAPAGSATTSSPPGVLDRLPADRQGGLSEADGVVPAGVTVFDGRHPAIAKLDPALLGALRRAATDAGRAGITLYVDSGWRSPAYQDRLLSAAIAKYGSEAEAARWVAPPATSAHVSGNAVDIGPSRATAWLSRHGAAHGLCQIYRNEPWHFELRPAASVRGCPSMYADAAHDPRMQR